METELSKPLSELPTFLATITMVTDDQPQIVKSLIHAERKSPPRYEAAREMFIKCLEGKFSHEEVLREAKRLSDPVDRKCAVDVLQTSENFLVNAEKGRIERLPPHVTAVPFNLELNVGPLWVRHTDPERIMVLHFWQTPLGQRQLSAAAAIIQDTLLARFPRYAGAEIDFISVSKPDLAGGRRFQNLSWTKLAPLRGEAKLKFFKLLRDAWDAYQREPPRQIRRKPSRDLFGG